MIIIMGIETACLLMTCLLTTCRASLINMLINIFINMFINDIYYVQFKTSKRCILITSISVLHKHIKGNQKTEKNHQEDGPDLTYLT